MAPTRVDPEKELLAQFNPADPYALIRIDQNMHDDNIICDVCLDGDDGEGDELIVCELCLVAVHQTCYGGEIRNKLPNSNEPWHCDRCKVLTQNSNLRCTQIRCEFCPDLDGAMKPVVLPGSKSRSGETKWAHVICVNWIPTVWWSDDINVAHLTGKMPTELNSQACTRCKNQRGACIPCDWKKCFKRYHVRCAVKMDMIEELESMLEGLGGSCAKNEFPLFCGAHLGRGRQTYREKGLAAITCRQPRHRMVK